MKNQRLYDYLKSKDPEKLDDLEKDMLRDWGNEEIYGPWTEHRTDDWDVSTGFKIYKSYYLISTDNNSPNIDNYYPEINISFFNKITNQWRKVFKVPVGIMSVKKARKRLSELVKNLDEKDINMPIDFSDTRELLHKINNIINEDKMEICTRCGKATDVPRNLDIDLRKNYVEGIGQLCGLCYNLIYNNKLP